MNASKKAFTLVEMLVVISVIGLLTALLVPALVKARTQALSIVCQSNLRQLVVANIGYSGENDGFCVPAASDLWQDAGGYQRWHGVRDNCNEPFDALQGPLVEYLSGGKVKECPASVTFVKGEGWDKNFEEGCGGYGYNMTYIGSRLWQSGSNFKQKYSETARMAEITKPSTTLMFADCAMSRQTGYYMEYSFAEPPYFVMNGQLLSGTYTSPSIHFRHCDRANIGWSDGHTDSRQMVKLKVKNAYGIQSADMQLGWFEPVDNSLFDLK